MVWMTMEGVCRGCLLKFNDSSELNIYSEKNRRLFVYITGIQVKRNDSFTFQLCKMCYSSMKIACNFKKTCKASDRKIKNFLQLRESGDIDFTTFLKSTDEPAKIRFPAHHQYDSPQNKTKEDDNLSTSTSIRNFMKDILQGDEIPDNEARIISEVIQEEADISDDSLDSHWLQDDVSVASDLRLEFSFSPFSTTHSINNDHCYTLSNTLNQDDVQNNQLTSLPELNHKSDAEEIVLVNDKIQLEDLKIANDENRCVIDTNLENALRDGVTDNFSLEEILATPPMIANAWAPSTPTINNILFGEKLEDIHKSGHNIEKYEEVEGTSNDLDEFVTFNQFDKTSIEDVEIESQIESVTDNVNHDNEDKIELNGYIENYENEKEFIKSNEEIKESDSIFKRPLSPIENKYSIDNFLCKICDIKLKSLRSLQLHMYRNHGFQVKVPKVKNDSMMICDYCGKTFLSKKEFFIKHIALHMNPDMYRCKNCSLTFSAESRLKMHQSTHTGVVQRKPIEKKYVCTICGATCTSSSNYKVHLRRHSNDYSCRCEECGAGFYRRTDLTLHIRTHTGERPYKCKFCPSAFKGHSTLNKHMKLHTGEKPYKCDICQKRFSVLSNLKCHQMKSIECMRLQEKIAFSEELVYN